jgi:diguanylate cyclase (GGDEF)-like protein
MLRLHVVSEFWTGLAYLGVVMALLFLARKRSDLIYGWQLWLFTIFVLVCGLRELLEIRIMFPVTRLEEGTVEFLRAILAVAALMALPSLVRRLVRLPSPLDLRNALKRLRIAKTETAQVNRWLSLGEEVGHVGHWRARRDRPTIKCSDGVYKILGWDGDGSDVAVDRLKGTLLPEDWRKVVVAVGRAFVRRQGFEVPVRFMRAGGDMRHVLLRGVLQPNEDDEVASLFGVIVDQTDQKLVEAELLKARAATEAANRRLEALALRDVLTGLANQRHFDATLAGEIRRARRMKIELALLLIEVDDFDQYTEAFGRSAADRCLIAISAAIERSLHRAGDLAALFEDDRFAVLLPNSNEAGAVAVAERILRAVRDMKMPRERDGPAIMTVSIGAAEIDGSSATQDPLALVGLALEACEMAKKQGQDQVCQSSLRQVQ